MRKEEILRKVLGILFVVLPSALQKGDKRSLQFEYSGKEVVPDAGGGNFYIGARTGWFPSMNGFRDYATYDLTFRVPKNQVLVGSGKPLTSVTEGDWSVTLWGSEVPLAVAGFNFARYKKKEAKDAATRYDFESYSTSDVPDWLRTAQIGGAPGSTGVSPAGHVQ